MAAGWLTPQEGVVLNVAANEARPAWAEVGARLGWTAAHCAVARVRAIARLRAYLFLHRPKYLGGAAQIARAFGEALKLRGEGSLTAEQAQVFRRMVIEQDHAYRTIGWRKQLSEACAIVIRFLELDERGPL
jgi:hypothetical protein